ncbi:MAG: rod shape-determining protein MreC [Firmicutes bacterium]|nr:rod shape-determining protein MreC [Bacillota bacterium]
MLQFLTSRKLVFIAMTLLLLSWVIFLTTNNRTDETAVEAFLRTAVTPVERIFNALTDWTHSLARTVAVLHRLARENRRLAEEVDRLRMENLILRGYRLENERLREALGLRPRLSYDFVAAEVVARNPSNWYGRLTIDRGAADGITRDMGVIAPEGVVGRIYAVRKHTAEVLLLTDSMSQLGGMVERTGAHLLLRGESGRPGFCRIIPLKDADYAEGDIVVTWEESEYFPPGIPIGRVVEASKGQAGMPLGGSLRPAVDPGRLEVVFVIRQVPQGAEER